jgi:three-Cys-motif partner protein
MTQAAGAQTHPDQSRFVEDHRQTEHKLDLFRRYPPRWASILASARGGYVDASHLFLVDGCAGAGIHRSRDHPDGLIPGTALLACYTAREIQRRHRVEVHVRLIDSNPEYCRILHRLTDQFRQAEGRDRVDVEVINERLSLAVHLVLAETDPARKQYRSLWLVDPYGTREIPHVALELLDRQPRGPEIIVNLATGGILRACGRGPGPAMDPDHRAHLEELYGGTRWERAFSPRIPSNQRVPMLAQLYRESFPGSPHGGVYALRRTGGQVRHFIHLAKSPRAQSAFKADYEGSFKVGLFAGRMLNEADKAKVAQQLFDAFRGEVVGLEAMYASRITQLDRGQLRSVMTVADRNGYGRWDHLTGVMAWRLVRVEPATLTLDLEF